MSSDTQLSENDIFTKMLQEFLRKVPLLLEAVLEFHPNQYFCKDLTDCVP